MPRTSAVAALSFRLAVAGSAARSDDPAAAGGPAFALPERRSVAAIGLAADGRSLVAVVWDKAPDRDGTRFSVRTWDVAAESLMGEVELDWDQSWNRFAGTMIPSRDAATAAGSLGGHVGVWDLASRKLVTRLDPPAGPRREIKLDNLSGTPDLSRVACRRTPAPLGGLVPSVDAVVWDVETGRVLLVIEDESVHDSALSADGSRLAAVGPGGGVDVWDVETGERVLAYRHAAPGRAHPDPEVGGAVSGAVRTAGLASDGRRLAVSDMLGETLVDAGSGEVLRRLDAPYRYQAWGGPGFVFSADGRRFARVGTGAARGAAQEDRATPVWSTGTGEAAAVLPVETNDASFSGDGGWFAAARSDGEAAVAVWKIGR